MFFSFLYFFFGFSCTLSVLISVSSEIYAERARKREYVHSRSRCFDSFSSHLVKVKST